MLPFRRGRRVVAPVSQFHPKYRPPATARNLGSIAARTFTSRPILATIAHALAEVRRIRRSTRFGVFVALTVATSLALFLFYAQLYVRSAPHLATAGSLAPENILALHGATILSLFLAGTVFLAPKIRSKSRPEEMVEVLHSRPFANVNIVAGKVLGMALCGWCPLVFVAGAMCLADPVISWLFSFHGSISVEAFSTFVFIDALPALLLLSAIAVLLSTWVRIGVAVVLFGLVLVSAYWLSTSTMDTQLVPTLAMLSNYGNYESQILPAPIDATVLVHRASLAVLIVGIVAIAAGSYPRCDDQRLRTALIGLVSLAVGSLGVYAAVADSADEVAQRRTWLAAHSAASAAPEDLVDVEHIGGVVEIAPDEHLLVDLRLRLSPQGLDFPSTITFSLNPGMDIEELRVNDTGASYSHDLGLLTVDLPAELREPGMLTISLLARGIPNPAFAYLDSAIDWRTEPAANALLFLGRDGSIFDSRYVALMPSARWLPAAGPNVGRMSRYRDPFTLDLQVQVPPDWHVAGAGPANVSDGGREFRFRPGKPLAEVMLIASDFERLATSVADVELELLVSARHMDEVRLFDDATPLILDRLADVLRDANEAGLPYPYKKLSVVEVPSRLRGYRGGWRMDSALATPGVVLIREDWLRAVASQRTHLRDRTAAEKTRLIESYFHNDDTGGDPRQALAHSLFASQVGFAGQGAFALEFLFERLVNRLLLSADSDFSAHDFNDASKLAVLIRKTFLAEVGLDVSAGSYTTEVEDVLPSVWDRVVKLPLSELDPQTKPREALEALRLKSYRMADLILDRLGREATARVLAETFRQHAGHATAEAQVSAVARQVVGDRWPDLDAWLHDGDWPGFFVSSAHVHLVENYQTGKRRYITNFHVRNKEATPGFVEFTIRRRGAGGSVSYDSDPIHIGAEASVEVGFESLIEPNELFVEPYLALNRRPIYVDLDQGLNKLPAITEPFVGIRPSTWKPPETEGLVVDDLDEGFSVIGGMTSDMSLDRVTGAPLSCSGCEMDQGLPVYRPPGQRSTAALWRDGVDSRLNALSLVGEWLEWFVDDGTNASAHNWSRQELPSAWGRYRHTVVRTPVGDARWNAAFRAEIPVPGRWRLDYHVPDLGINAPGRSTGAAVTVGLSRRGLDVTGSYHMRLIAGTTVVDIDLPSPIGPPGWRTLGDYRLVPGSALLVVTNRSTGKVVVADAIRWRLLAEQADASAK